MLSGGRLKDDKQDLFSVSFDENHFGDSQDAPVYQNNVFSNSQEVSSVQQRHTFSKHETSSLVQDEFSEGTKQNGSHRNDEDNLTRDPFSLCFGQELPSTEQISQDFTPDDDYNEEEAVFAEQVSDAVGDTSALSDSYTSQSESSEEMPSQRQDGAEDSEGSDGDENVKDIISGGFVGHHVDDEMFPCGQDLFAGGVSVQQCVFPESLSSQQDHNIGKEMLPGGRTAQRLDARLPPRQLDMELDLDYLERRGDHARTPRCPPPEAEASPDSMDLVKVILLGAPAVGKTSIIQQFVWNDFSEEYVPTDRKHTYYPSVIINEHLYELKISDIPVIPYFPVNSYYEWTDYRFYGLRSATAYVLVFDLSNADTFQYIRTLREQMLESRDMRNVPLLVVGNKQDLLVSATAPGGSAGGNGAAGGSGVSGSGGATAAITGSATGTSSGKDVEYREKRRDIVNLVKKHWKCTYVECSAKYNWRVVAVFKELMKAVDSLETGQSSKEVCSPMMDNLHEALDRNKCIIL
ncbi:uncharacterized protein [Periplaneta americana]|uniref:uncharacterized protein n=1 Tax=Periplaneta americana TaxID=6978 RepID=UPI0037E8869F